MIRWALCAAFLATLAGCGGGGPVTHAVSGTITYINKPVADAQVGFVPADTTGQIKPARGQTDSAGRYTLTTYVTPEYKASGAMAGKFNVTVEKGLPQNQIVTYDDIKNQKPEIPPAYADSQKTKLKAEVTAAGPNQFDFTLQDGP
jgi:hypothetical protein